MAPPNFVFSLNQIVHLGVWKSFCGTSKLDNPLTNVVNSYSSSNASDISQIPCQFPLLSNMFQECQLMPPNHVLDPYWHKNRGCAFYGCLDLPQVSYPCELWLSFPSIGIQVEASCESTTLGSSIHEGALGWTWVSIIGRILTPLAFCVVSAWIVLGSFDCGGI